MKALDRKMWRDLMGMRGQAVAIAFVVVSGIATYVSMATNLGALEQTLAVYYLDYRFADIFGNVRRAPETLGERIRDIAGVGQVQTRVLANVNLEVPGFDEPVSGQLLSVPEDRQPPLNRLFVRKGRMVHRGAEDEVILNEVFANAQKLEPGDYLYATINGRRKRLNVVGIGLSPEFLIQVQPGSMFPDPARFGVLWMGRDALAAAYDMEGAFNSVVLTLAPGANEDAVVDRLDVLLKPYGSQGVQTRERQPSHFFITSEFEQLRTMVTVLPTIFLGVAAFLLNIVVTRLMSTQREQIAVLKAFGYSNLHVGLHYIKLVMVIAISGAIIGVLLGAWLGGGMAELYLEYYRFPYLDYRIQPSVVLTAVGFTIGATLVGVIQAVRGAASLPPAEAMRPAPPASYRPSIVERMGMQRWFDQPSRMILRHLGRQRMKSFLTVIGIAFSCAILIVGHFFNDSFDYMVKVQYGLAQREDLTVTFIQPTSTAALYELKSLPGVQDAEPIRYVPVRLHFGHRNHETTIEGISPRGTLHRVIDTDLKQIEIPQDGIVLTDHLADIMKVEIGDMVAVEMLEGSRRTRRVPVVGLAKQYLGTTAYMDLGSLNRMTGDGQAISGAALLTDERYQDEINEKLQSRPRVASIVSQDRAIQAFNESSAEMMLTMTFILTLFAGAIAFGVVYNNARISLSERDRELASLRVLGFTRGEISYILIGEMALLTILAIPLGFMIGTGMSMAMIEALKTDLYQIPVVLRSGTYTFAALVVLVCFVISALIVRGKLNNLDLVGVLKTRE